MKNKFLNLFLVIAATLLLYACKAEKTNPEVFAPESQAHKEMYSKLVNVQSVCGKPMPDGRVVCRKQAVKRKKAVGDSYKGKWLFTILQKDRKLVDGTIIAKAEVDAGGNVISSDTIDPNSISPNQVVYVGYTALDEGSGYDIISNNRNYRAPLTNIKVDGNKLEWELSFSGDPNSKIFTQPMIFKTKAFYNPKTDKLSGETKFGMNFNFNDASDLNNIKNKTVYIPMGSYVWHATRLTEHAFQELTKPGQARTDIPQYVVGIDTKHPAIAKQMFKK